MQTRKKKNGKLIKAVIPVLAGIAIGWAVILTAMSAYGRHAFPESAEEYITNMFLSFDERSGNIMDVEQYGMATNELLIRNVASAYAGFDFLEVEGVNSYVQARELRDLIADSDIRAIHIVSGGGKILLTTDTENLILGASIVVSGVLTQAQFDRLKETAKEMDMMAIMRSDMNSKERDYQEPLVVENRRQRKEFYAATSTAKVRNIYAPVSDNYVIMECSGKVEGSYRSVLGDLSTYFSVGSPAGNISGLLVNTDTGIVLYGSDDFAPMAGDIAAAHGIRLPSIVKEDGVKDMTINGEKCRVYSAKYQSDELGNLALVCRHNPVRVSDIVPVLVLLVFLTAVVIVITICGITMEATEKKAVVKKMTGLVILGAVLVSAAAFCLISIAEISRQMASSPRIVDAFLENTSKNAKAGEEVNDFYLKRVVSIARSTRTYMERLEGYALSGGGEEPMLYLSVDETGKAETVPDVYGNPTRSIPKSGLLEGLSYLGAFDTVYILDPNGRAIATSGSDWHYDIISGRHETDEEVRKVLHRQTPYYYYMEEDEESTEKGTTIAVPMNLYVSNDKENGKTVYHNREDFEKDKTGTIEKKYGVLLIKNTLSNTVTVGYQAGVYASLSAVESAANVHASLVSADAPHKSKDYHHLTEAEINALGFTDEEYQHDSYRFASCIYGDVFASLMKIGDVDELAGLQNARATRMLIMNDKKEMFADRSASVITVVTVSILLLMLSYAVVVREKKAELLLPAAETPEQRMERTREERKAENRAGVVIGRLVGAAAKLVRLILYLAALFLIFYGVRAGVSTEGSFFSYVIMKQWPKDLNVFSVSYVVYLSVIITAILSAAGNLVELVASSLSPVAETVARLALSIVRYAGIMILAFYSMQMLGVQTGTVITFGGILTGVIGLGANSLISDIIAGLFIIFERQFRVNDIVTIDGFTGVVRGISLRTTRVQDAVGNVKTFNNSKIGAVLNLTENYSTAFATVNVSLEVPVAKVETLVNTELPKRMAENRDIVEGPWFSGIMEIKNGFYMISVAARCEQQKQWSVKKELTKYVLELLKENGIKIA